MIPEDQPTGDAPKDDAADTGAKDGVMELPCKDWRAFLKLILSDVMLPSGAIWRGQRRDYPMRPSLERDLPARGKAQWRLVYARQLEKFKIAVAGRRGANPRNLDGKEGTEDEDDEWWALGQQNGLKTPLLDWTESPYAALFFAFDEDSSAEMEAEESLDHWRYVYALNPSALYWKHSDLEEARLKEWEANPEPEPPVQANLMATTYKRMAWERRREERLREPWIRVIRPHTDENVRLLSQGGLFTQAPPGRAIEEFVQDKFRGDTLAPMYKFMIGDVDRHKCLMALNRMAINHRTLFPDLHGACRFTNMFIEWPSY